MCVHPYVWSVFSALCVCTCVSVCTCICMPEYLRVIVFYTVYLCASVPVCVSVYVSGYVFMLLVGYEHNLEPQVERV